MCIICGVQPGTVSVFTLFCPIFPLLGFCSILSYSIHVQPLNGHPSMMLTVASVFLRELVYPAWYCPSNSSLCTPRCFERNYSKPPGLRIHVLSNMNKISRRSWTLTWNCPFITECASSIKSFHVGQCVELLIPRALNFFNHNKFCLLQTVTALFLP